MYQFLKIACLYTVYYIYVLECFCNINHCNKSAPCWDLDWTIKSYLILSYLTYKTKDRVTGTPLRIGGEVGALEG